MQKVSNDMYSIGTCILLEYLNFVQLLNESDEFYSSRLQMETLLSALFNI